jgi:ribonuclease HII
MLAMHQQYPQYQFAAHKGYGTAVHLAALRAHGASPIHRKSFRPVLALDQLARADANGHDA